ncbi:hypothetical protein V9T40_006405 [Parthenolecanium corni]|uniref:Uncharacterized protein n=1 Tax=Parthenolecanium corni TaxID=536013 RepID=A0AAN9TXQ8_9HEMI
MADPPNKYLKNHQTSSSPAFTKVVSRDKHNRVIVILVATVIAQSSAEEKWIWSKETKTGTIQSDTTKISVAKPILNDAQLGSRRKIDDEQSRFLIDDDLRRARYEVQELTDPNTGWSTGQSRPFSIRPFINRPQPPLLPDRPPVPLPDRPPPPYDYNPQTAGNEQPPIRRQPPPQSVGILTGPIPSWEKPTLHKNGDPTNFEHCKCSFSFNCKSPGIQFGSCDQGKTYCCYNDLSGKDGQVPPTGPNAFGSVNVDRYDRGPPVLAGPGGPVDGRRPGSIDHREAKPLLPGPPRGHGYRPYQPTYEENDDELDSPNYTQKPYPIIPQKPVLPPYMGLHNDYRSS